MAKTAKFIFVIAIIFFLSLVQFYFSGGLAIFGVRFNFVLSGLVALMIGVGFGPILVGGFLAGVLAAWTAWNFDFAYLSFPLVILVLYFLTKRIIFNRSAPIFFALGAVATIFFNLFFALFSWVFYSFNFWPYFFSLGNILEIVFNGILTLIFSLIFKKIFLSKDSLN